MEIQSDSESSEIPELPELFELSDTESYETADENSNESEYNQDSDFELETLKKSLKNLSIKTETTNNCIKVSNQISTAASTNVSVFQSIRANSLPTKLNRKLSISLKSFLSGKPIHKNSHLFTKTSEKESAFNIMALEKRISNLYNIFEQLHEVKQSKRESTGKFAERIHNIIEQAYDGKDETEKEKDRIQFFMRGIQPKVKIYLDQLKTPDTFKQAILMVEKEERMQRAKINEARGKEHLEDVKINHLSDVVKRLELQQEQPKSQKTWPLNRHFAKRGDRNFVPNNSRFPRPNGTSLAGSNGRYPPRDRNWSRGFSNHPVRASPQDWRSKRSFFRPPYKRNQYQNIHFLLPRYDNGFNIFGHPPPGYKH